MNKDEMIDKDPPRACGYRDENGEYPCDKYISLEYDYCREHESLVYSGCISKIRGECNKLKQAVEKMKGALEKMKPAFEIVHDHYLSYEEHASVIGVSMEPESAQRVSDFWEAHEALKEVELILGDGE